MEVTNAEYAGCVRDAKCPPPSDWVGNKPLAERERWPVVNVSFQDAKAFAAWRSKRDGMTYRLPTEEEWEYAARGGSKNYLYPWGNTWRDDCANVKPPSGTPSLKPVGSYPLGASVWGVLDMIGNAQEWTSSKMSLYSGNNKLKLTDEEREKIVVRGGSYVDEASGPLAITATRRQGIAASTKYPTFGFRLVRSIF
jgi:formylglycine-generating enzyme required for sulfatase activity